MPRTTLSRFCEMVKTLLVKTKDMIKRVEICHEESILRLDNSKTGTFLVTIYGMLNTRNMHKTTTLTAVHCHNKECCCRVLQCLGVQYAITYIVTENCF